MIELGLDMQVIKQSMKEVWSAGDFGVVAKLIEHEGAAFIERLKLNSNVKLLDVACGTGNLAIPAARAGAKVTGLDLVDHLIRQAEIRASEENLEAEFVVGDAENMPFNDNEFDYVVSMFGAIFAPRPDVTANELLRVCKSGGIIAMANWTPEGSVGEMFRLMAGFLPPPPGLESPALWGIEDIVRQRFGDKVREIKFKKRLLRQRIPMSPAEVVEYFRQFFGPTQKAFLALDEDGQRRLRQALTDLWKKNNLAHDGTTMIDAEYLEVVAVKK